MGSESVEGACSLTEVEEGLGEETRRGKHDEKRGGGGDSFLKRRDTHTKKKKSCGEFLSFLERLNNKNGVFELPLFQRKILFFFFRFV